MSLQSSVRCKPGLRLPSRHPEPRGGAGVGGTIGPTAGCRRCPQSPVHRTHQPVGPPGCLHAGERALETARASGEEEAVAEALDAIEVASVMVGDFDRVETLADELSAIHRRRGEMWYLQYPIYQSFWGPLAHGEWDTALQRLNEAETIAEGLQDRGVLPLYAASRSWLERSRGAYGEALSQGRRAVASAEELGHLEWQALSSCRCWTRRALPRGWRRGRFHPRLGTGVGDGDRGRRHRHAGPRRRIPDRRASRRWRP